MSVNKTFNKLPIEPYEMKQHFGSSNHINKALSYKKESYQLKGLKKIKWCWLLNIHFVEKDIWIFKKAIYARMIPFLKIFLFTYDNVHNYWKIFYSMIIK